MYIEVICDFRDGEVWAQFGLGEWSGKPHLDPEQTTLYVAPVPELARQVLDVLRQEHEDAFEEIFKHLFLAGMDVECANPETIEKLREVWRLDTQALREEEHRREMEERAEFESLEEDHPNRLNSMEKDHLLGREIWQGFKPPE